MKKIFELVKVMFKIGCIGFGGGSALIPVLEREIVNKKKMIDREKYDKNVVVASITPGALPVEIAAGIGYHVCSYAGMLAASMSMALPGAIFTILLLTIFNNMEETVLKYVNYIAVPISIYIIYILIQYMIKSAKVGCDKREKLFIWIVIVTVFILNGGKEISNLTGWDGLLFFDVSSIQILGTAFFLIFYLSGEINFLKIFISVSISTIYFILVGKNNYNNNLFEKLCVIVMLTLGIYGIIKSFRKQKIIWNINWKEVFKCVIVWCITLTIMITPACILNNNAFEYFSNGLLSSIISFGGGDAYLSVADGLFVQSGMITEDSFFGRLVVIVNILPGSILCKTLSGIGYIMAYESSGQFINAITMAIGGFGVSVFGSCCLSITCLHLYSGLECLDIIKGIKKWIRPIIGGLLLSICVSMSTSIIEIGTHIGIEKGLIAVILLIILIINWKKLLIFNKNF